jgi:CheY-like chemotaxis protein
LVEIESLPDEETFGEWVRDALNHLYDSPHLQDHPLKALLPQAEGSPERAQALRRIILGAIRKLRPAAGTPANSADWRGYRILELRYVEGLGPTEAMKELALGRSQFFREQKHALDALSARLWEDWKHPHKGTPGVVSGHSRAELFSSAVEQLTAQGAWEPITPEKLWAELAPLLEPLARAEGATLRFVRTAVHDCIETDRVLLRQVVLDVLAGALRAAPGGCVTLSCFSAAHASGLQIDMRPAEGTALAPRQIGSDVARRLMAAMGGILQVGLHGEEGWRLRLAWPSDNPTLLVIDDNTEFADLYRRYLAGRNWRVIGASSGREALAQLAHLHPTVILLDVLMPSEDGWELLVTLKACEDSRHIPIIICSVLEQPGLAMSLGAEGYLAKPVAQSELLRILAPWHRAVAHAQPGR